MTAITDLSRLLATIEPVLHANPYGFAVTALPIPAAFATVAEEEGLTVIARQTDLQAVGVDAGPDFARISLTVHSDLAAVGLTAALARALADRGISANVVAGFHHDHIFLPWERRHDAMAALRELSHA